jgi:hypothetical protein
MILATAKPDREMGAFQIFWRFARDVLLTGAIYALLIGARSLFGIAQSS